MSVPAYLINGLDLATALGLTLTDDTTWRSSVSVRRSPITIPGQHGTLNPSRPVIDESKVSVDAWAIAASQAQLEEAVNQFNALAMQSTLTLTRASGGITTSAIANLVSIAHSDYVEDTAAHLVALFAIPAGLFRETVANGDDIAFSANLVNTELVALSGSSGPIVDAVVRITGPATSVSITDPGTGTGLTWAGTLAAGQYLFLCAKPLSGRISANASDWISGGTDQSPLVSHPAAGRLELCPVVQSGTVRKILLSASGVGRSAATKIAVRAGRCYL